MEPTTPGGRAGAAWLLPPAFLLLATANAGGYRFGAADQAFYIPAILRHLDPALFPRDRVLIDPQSQTLLLDEVAAWLAARAGLSLEAMFLAGFVVAGLLLGLAAWRLARQFGSGAWTAAAFVIAMTLRHRVTQTGVNTFEGYFHPRVLAFALGLLAVTTTAGLRPLATASLLLLALAVHPTTALWFAVWVGIAWVAILARARAAGARPGVRHARVPAAARLGAGLLGVMFLGVVLLLATRGDLWAQALKRMDPAWLALLATKDYLFPTDWAWPVWASHLAVGAVIVAGYRWRRASGVAAPQEGALLGGYAAVVALFLASLPLVAARIALAVQLQTSRVLWGADALATFYLVWMLAEAGGGVRRRRTMALLALLAAASATRGAYVTWVESPGRGFVRAGLPRSAWTEALQWLRTHTPTDAHVLADPGHAWKYEVTVRIGAARDVFLEEVKDTAMALYARPVAARVLERIEAAGPFDSIPARLDVLAERYGLTHLVAERPPAGPAIPARYPRLWDNGRFAVYALRPGARSSVAGDLGLHGHLH